ncbi:MAG: FAD/NAD(P)-binding protein [Planctomycetia bacterium]|nr:FAD/NAD(P)-binding protein [Planctomycetia bacterium]
MTTENIYKPDLMEVVQVVQQTVDVKSVRIRFRDPERAKAFSFRVGQFGLYSVFGVGESTFNICCSNSKDYIEFCFRKTGRVTEAMWGIEVGSTIGFRGPFGNSYPVESWEGKDLIFVGGGIAMPPIRCAIEYALENREKYGRITVVYGARTVGDLVFRDELDEWAKYPNVDIVKTVDPGGETADWNGRVGFVPTVLGEAGIQGNNAVALVVGPPIMIKFSLPVLSQIGIADADIYTSLENRMKCGLGKCGRCNCGSVYVCKDGPVFNLEQMKQLPDDF